MRAKATKGVEVQPSCVCRDEAGAKRAACARTFSMGCPVHSAMMRFRLALWYMISFAWISMSTACAPKQGRTLSLSSYLLHTKYLVLPPNNPSRACTGCITASHTAAVRRTTSHGDANRRLKACLAAGAAERLVDHDARVGHAVALALGAGAQQERPHGRG